MTTPQSATPTTVSSLLSGPETLITENKTTASSFDISKYHVPTDSPFIIRDETFYLKLEVEDTIFYLRTNLGAETIDKYCEANLTQDKWLCTLSTFYGNLISDQNIAELQEKADKVSTNEIQQGIEGLLTNYSASPLIFIITSNKQEITILPKGDLSTGSPNWKSACGWLDTDKIQCHINHGMATWTTIVFDLKTNAYENLPDNGFNITIYGQYYLQDVGYFKKTVYNLQHTALLSFTTPVIHTSEKLLAFLELCENGAYCFRYIEFENYSIKNDKRLNLSRYLEEASDCSVQSNDVSDFMNNSHLTAEAWGYTAIICRKILHIFLEDMHVTEVLN